MNKTNAGFLAFLGVAAAFALGAFFLAPNLFRTNPESGSEPAPKSSMVDATVKAPEAPAAGQGLPTEAAKADSEASDASDPALVADNWVMPSFDVLRVEPDGSTVIAGKAEPGTSLDIMNGETVIASTMVGPSGDFAVILDNPLPAGDYQLTLQIAGKDGTTRQSEEVATVSIPETADGELLAMVSKPGKASRIIAQPVAPATQEAVEVASAAPGSDNTKMPDQPAAAGTDTGGGAPVAEAPNAEATVTGTDQDVAAKDAAAVEGKTEMAAAVTSPGDVPSAVGTPALPEASSLLTESAPQIASEGEGAKSSETAPSSESEATVSEPEATVDVAMASPEAAADATPVAIPAEVSVRVDAVEIEGDRIFIAGSATPGFKVQVAADGVVIGTDKADETGRFIVEATSQLTVGDHTINADLMDETGENVMLRATVPFNRPEGEALAAVAPAEPAITAAEPAQETSVDAQTAEADVPAELILPDIASLSKMREDAFEALSDLKKMVSSAESADTAAVSTALEKAIEKLKSAAMADLPADSSKEALAIARSMRIQAQAALAVIMPKVAGAASSAGDQSGAPQGALMIDNLVTGDLTKLSEILTQAETVLSEPADMTVAAVDEAEGLTVSSDQPGEPKTILQAPLASTPGAVIIRRGDTLWQISRRTYGEGVRYTTIYVANRSQIQNPDRIKPGQVFSVPENPLENAEELHQQLLGKGKKP